MKRRLLLVVITALAVSLVIAGCAQKAQAPPKEQSTPTEQKPSEAPKEKPEAAKPKPITLKYAFFAPANTFPAVQMKRWAEELEKRTNGKVKVETFPGGTLLTAQNMYDGVLQGVADIGLSCPSYEPGRFPLLAIADLPVSFYPNSRVASLVLWDLIQEFKPKSLENFKVITAFTTEPAYVQTIKPVKGLNDLKGLQLRTSGTGVPLFQALGAAPVGMSQADVPQALQTGVIKGYVSSREVLKDFKYAEIVKYVTDYPSFVVSFVAAMNKNVWNSLPPDVQQVIDQLGREMALWTGQYMDNYVKEVMEWAKKEHGVQVVTLSAGEKAKWDEKVKPVQDKYVADAEAKGLPGKQFLKRLIELRDKYSQEFK